MTVMQCVADFEKSDDERIFMRAVVTGLAASEAGWVVGLAKARLPVTPSKARQRWANAGRFVLADDPEIGDTVPEFDTSTLRELIHPPFRIMFRHDAIANPIHGVRGWRGKRTHKFPDQGNRKAVPRSITSLVD